MASKRMPDGGVLRVTAENVLIDHPWPLAAKEVRQTRQVQFTISHTGQGIPAGMQERLFERGYTGLAGTPARGLFAMNTVIKAHHGVVSVAGGVKKGLPSRFALPAAPGSFRNW